MNFDEMLQLLPENASEVGEKILKGLKFKNFTKGEELKFFDEIIDRPFMEVLLLSFYFSDDSKLQNSIMGLIHRCTSQKLTFFNMINKLEILFSKEQIDVYESFNHLVQKLNNLVSNSQVLFIFDWLFRSIRHGFISRNQKKTIFSSGKWKKPYISWAK